MFESQRIVINKKEFIQIVSNNNHIAKTDSLKAYNIIFNTINDILKRFKIGDKLILPKAIVIEAKKPIKVANNITKKKIRFSSKLYLNKIRNYKEIYIYE